jgi:hypothetical protein
MAADIARFFIASQVAAYAVVFAAEGVLFLVSAVLADRIARQSRLARGLAEQPRKEPDISGLALGR